MNELKGWPFGPMDGKADPLGSGDGPGSPCPG